jgi:acyl carrier protein
MALSRDEIMDKVHQALVDALGVDEDEVIPTARIKADLGAESIDFLDIVFRLEKAFNIKIQRGDLFPDNILTTEEFVQQGSFTPKGLDELKVRMPYADLTPLAKDPKAENLWDVFTVDMVVRFIEARLSGAETAVAPPNPA